MTDTITLNLRNVVLSPSMTIEQISTLCRSLSTEEIEVHARIEFGRDKPIAYLMQSVRDQQIPEFLRR